MTIVGAGGAALTSVAMTKRFEKDFKALSPEQQDLVDAKLKDLMKNPRPPGLRFEKLKGYTKPNIYTIHVTGNYKISFELNGNAGILRRVGTHNEIDRCP